MDINHKAKEFASYIKNTDEFKYMNKCKIDIEKNRSLKRQFDSYINTKNSIYSRYKIEDATARINKLNKEYDTFFNLPLVANYMEATKNFNAMMERLYKTIEKELVK
ncbi:YlbF family regulator [Romboutsia sp. CE17]|uniref:YlbF family regulator n=1 Tax=Romboutsia sp. CE17 TaxID=2724150 RepID=UPI001442E48C|nr:YlbF family regulator [Romboutsia sp. CE17]QJA08981.1 YlbF family regulator [Romboutsia sp. CE17]